MASEMIAGAVLAGALGWIPWPHHNGAQHHYSHHRDKHMPAASVAGQVGGARYVNEGGVILVPAVVKDRGPYLFMLDTSSAHSSIDAKTAYQAQVGFWGENSSPAATAKEAAPRRLAATTFQVGDAQLFSPEPHALYKPLNLVGSARGRLGMDVLAGYVVRVDPRYRMVTIHDPLRFSKPINSVSLPLTVTEDGVFLPVTLKLADGSSVVRSARLDTGLTWTMADDAATVSQIASVELGGWSVPQTAGHGPGVGTPSIGMGLLQGFITSIDVPDRVLYLQSAGKYKPDFQYTAHAKGKAKPGAPARPKKKKRFGIFW
jgi:hypothetical protein